MSEELMVIPRNPPQAPPSLFRVSRSLKVRGDAIYIIFGGIAGSVVVFFIMMDIALPLALGLSWMPLAGALWFYFKFVRGKPRFYFDYVLNGIFGRSLILPQKKFKKLQRTFHA